MPIIQTLPRELAGIHFDRNQGCALANAKRGGTTMTAQTEFRVPTPRTDERRREAFANAPRIHSALTADVEKRILIWLARRTPAAIGPDHLTALGFAAQILAGAAYALAAQDARWLWLVNLLLCLNWLGDSLDGTLARVRNQQRPRYGFYVDHMADTFGALALMTGLGFSGYLHWPVAAAMLAGYYVLAIESYLGHLHHRTFPSLPRGSSGQPRSAFC